MKNTNLEVKNEINALEKFRKLLIKIGTDDPKERDVQKFRQLLEDAPFLLNSTSSINHLMMKRIVQNNVKSVGSQIIINMQLDELKNELGYNTSSALERLVIEQIVLTYSKFHFAENTTYTSVDGQAKYEQVLSHINKRFTRAVETLAKIRKLAKRDPLFQINIAANGGQQVNKLESV